MLFVHSHAISLLEIPNEISLCLNISGCPCKCEGCSEPYLQEDVGDFLSSNFIEELLNKYKNYNLTCICFMGGDKDHKLLTALVQFLSTRFNLKIAFYSGLDYIDLDLVPYLSYYKIGRFILPKGEPKDWHKKQCGPINFPWSNQRLFKIENNKLIDITKDFQQNPITDLERYIIRLEDKDNGNDSSRSSK